MLDAQLWLVDEAFARWAQGQGAPVAVVEDARTRADASRALFEVLVGEEAVPAADATDALRSPLQTLACAECDARFDLACELVRALGEVRCPVCEAGDLEAGSEPPAQERREQPSTERFEPKKSGRQARMIGPYKLKRLLGAGGMGSVHLAVSPEGQEVALKLLGGAYEESARRERFYRESAFLREARHPNIVGVLDSGVDEASQRPWIALECVPGRDLETVIEDDGPLDTDEVIGVMDQVASALAYLHAKGILHRDLTAANVLATPYGEVKLSDFGLALDMSDSVRLTLTGKVVGTPVAIDPAVLRGEPWTPSSDLYALGIMGYRLLTGEDPFPGSNAAEVFEGQLSVIPPRVDTLREGVPSFLVELIVELLDKEAEARPNALDVRARLSDALPHAATMIRLGQPPSGSGDDDTGTWQSGERDTRGQSNEISSESCFAAKERFHHYEIEAEIGRGGMGVVYRARHVKLKRTVALKVLLRGSLAGKEERKRFLREAESAGVLNHPNVVPILDAGEHEGRTFICMDYVLGKSLLRHLREGGARRDLLGLFIQICDGVHHAHSRGVIHRDLKPDNVLVDEDGSPHILDFGIAKRLDQESHETSGGALTTEGDILGTLRYMPPEQAAGKVEDIDVRSDVYALGTILYELLCGTTPFKGTMAEVLHQIHFVQPEAPGRREKGIPWELNAICLKALEKDRDERYQSVLALKQDVQRFLDGLPITARRATPIYRLRKWASRNRGRAAALLTVVSLISILAAALAFTVIDGDRRYRTSVLTDVARALEHYEGERYKQAREAFLAASGKVRRGELVLLPADLAQRIPQTDSEDRHEQPEWVSADRLQRWANQSQHLEEEAEISRVLSEARESYDAGKLREAGQVLLVAARLDPQGKRVGALIKEVCAAFVQRGKQAVTEAPADDPKARRAALETARRSFEQAQQLDAGSRVAVAGLLEVASELGKLAEAEREAAVQARNRSESKRLVTEGLSHLKAKRLEDARRSFEQAVAFDGASSDARAGLIEVERQLDARLREKENADKTKRDAEEAKARADKVAALLQKAAGGLERGDLEAARVAFIQALAFDGANKEAQTGLVEVYRREEARKRHAERQRDLERVESFLRTGARSLEAGRRSYREGKDPSDVRERYFAAMEAVRKGLLLAPGHLPARQLLHKITAELGEILVDQGYPELSSFVRRMGGVPEDLGGELPHDPWLVVIEASAVNLRATFNTHVIFGSTQAFKGLRKKIRELAGDRIRARIEVRSHVEKKGLNTEVFIDGLWISLDDRKKKTNKKLGEIRFEGGPYRRIVQQDSSGRRIVRPFDQSRGLDPRPYVKRVEDLVLKEIRTLLQPPPPPKPPKGSAPPNKP